MAAVSLSGAALSTPLTFRQAQSVGSSRISFVRGDSLAFSHRTGRNVAAKALKKVVVAPSAKVSVGDEAPPVTLKDQNGKDFSLAKLKGKKAVVLYFYPADDTPGCTKQACSFRDSFAAFADLGAEVVGISGDSPESHKTFAEKYNLPFTLLSDEANAVRKEWGVPSDLFGVLPGRQTYVIDKKGIVKLVFNNQFQPEKHIDETIAVLELEPKDEPKAGFKFPKLF